MGGSGDPADTYIIATSLKSHIKHTTIDLNTYLHIVYICLFFFGRGGGGGSGWGRDGAAGAPSPPPPQK